MIPQITTLDVSTCAAETLKLTTACNAYAGDVFTYGLFIGCLAGAAGCLIGTWMWVYGRK